MLSLRVYSHSVGQNAYHLVFRTKYNIGFFSYGLCREAVEAYLTEAASRNGIGIYVIRVLPNHVHMFVELPPTLSVVESVKLLKGYSSRRFFKRFTGWRRSVAAGHDGPHLWSRWRFSRSVGNVNAGIIDNYIRNSSRNQYELYRGEQMTLG